MHRATALAMAATAFFSGTTQAAPTEDQLVRLSKLSMTALQCTYLAPNPAEADRLLVVGVEAGRRYVELARRERKSLDRAQDNIPGIYLQIDGPSADFVIGRAHGVAQARLDIDEIEAMRTGAAKYRTFRPSEYKRRDCAGLKLP
jgi:hypothetical protein